MTIDLAIESAKAATKKFVQIDCDDDRLPLSEELVREPPTDTFCESVWTFQIAPVGVVVWEDTYYFRWGAKRLLAIRRGKHELKEDGTPKHSGIIDVLFIEGIHPDDTLALSVIENNHRTPNPLNDYYIIREVLTKDPTATYKSFKAWGITAGQAKQLDEKYGRAPQWAVDGAMEGKIAPGTLETIAKIKSPELVKKLQKQYKTDGELPASAVKEAKQVHQTVNYAAMQQKSNLFTNVPVLKPSLSRRELEECMAQFESEKDKAIILKALNS